MPKDIYQFGCPCCGKQIEIDTRTGKARAQKPGEAKGGQDLDSLLQSQQREADRLGRQFEAAKDHQHKEQDLLGDLLKKAKEDARQSPDEKVRRPWDLD